MIKADGNFWAFFSRPIAFGLGVLAILVWLVPLGKGLYRLSTEKRRLAA